MAARRERDKRNLPCIGSLPQMVAMARALSSLSHKPGSSLSFLQGLPGPKHMSIFHYLLSRELAEKQSSWVLNCHSYGIPALH